MILIVQCWKILFVDANKSLIEMTLMYIFMFNSIYMSNVDTFKFGGLLINNLVCYLDAGDRKSFKGDNQWLDLSGQNNHFKFKTIPVTDS